MQVKEWCCDNCGDNWSYELISESVIMNPRNPYDESLKKKQAYLSSGAFVPYMRIEFNSKQDAMLFKLTYG